ncbi:MAG TPA: aminoglycoside adenylyltransferase domain-containing protein [Gaiellaceae bacterium]|nr:aminoglycoside adenylyltransferase domain-containing protein [Gaiellaceae bacterium]
MLDALVAGAREALGGNFLGAYLVGSFAVGDADEHSDVDFIVATRRELSAHEQDALQALHGQLYELPTPWAQHLEGSYVPADALRTPDPARTFFYLDNGSRELVWDTHCNTAVVRWTLREHGIVLAGEPAAVSVGHRELRNEACAKLDEYAIWTRERSTMSRWLQPYLVLSFCRMLQTLASATVVSKRVAGEWALRELDPEWRDLISAALADRPDPWLRVQQPAPADEVARTRQFIEYALAHGTDQRAARDD